MPNTNRGILAVLLLATACVSSTRTFVTLDRLRVKLIDAPTQPVEQSVRSVTSAVGPLVELRQPLAVIARLTNQDHDAHEFAIAADGTTVCQHRVSGGATRRVDCVVADWKRTSDQHDITVSGPGTAWTVTYLEVATHHGNTSGANYLVILPRASTNYVPAPLMFTALACLTLAGTMLFVVPAVFPRWAILGHRVFSGVVIAALAAVQISPWVSSYRIVLAAWTLILWLGVICLPRVWTLVQWTTTARRLPKHAWAVWARRTVIALGVLTVFWFVVEARLMGDHGGNYSGFLSISRRQFDVNPLLKDRDEVRQSLVILDNGGYDGQFMYFAAFDPFMRMFRDNPVKYRDVVDAVPYRYGRVGFSALTWFVTAGQWRWYPAVMEWLILAALFASALALATMADDEHLSPLLGALVVLTPGFWQSIQGALPEPLAAATLMAGILCLSRNRRSAAGLLFALSLVIRETGVLFVCAFAGATALSGRRRDAVTLALIALTPVIVWRLYVGWTIFPDWGFKGFLDLPADLGWPFAGFADLWSAIQRGDYYPDGPPMWRAGIAYPLLLTGAFLVSGALALRAPSAVNLAALAYALLAVSLNFFVWGHVGNGQRGSYELFVALALSVVAIRTYPQPLRVALVAFWCAAGLYVFYGAFDAEFIRAALSFPS